MNPLNATRQDLESKVAVAQGVYYFVTGVWPLLDIHSFEMVTGPKTDRWLVKTVGVVLAAVGGALIDAGHRGEVTSSTRKLAVGCALGLTAIEVYYVAKRRIAPIYLLDAVAELALVGLWTAAGRQPRRP